MVRVDVATVVPALLAGVALQGCGGRKAAPAAAPGGYSYGPDHAYYPPAAGQPPYGHDHAYYPPAAGQPPFGHDHAYYQPAAGQPPYGHDHAYSPDHAYYPPADGQPPYGPDHAYHPPAAGQPPYGHDHAYGPDHAYSPPATSQPPYGHPHGRIAVDGLPCEHSWTARWADGVRSTCRSYCCYHRNRFTHIRTRRSYCRVREGYREVLRQCVPRRPHTLALAVSPLEEPVELAAQDQASTNFEEPEGEETDSGMLQLGAQPLFACFSVAALSMFAFVVVKSRRSVGSMEHKEPLMES